MKLLNLRINFYLLRTFCPHLGSFLCCFFFHYVSAKFHLWPSSGDFTVTSDRNAESCNRIPSIQFIYSLNVKPALFDPWIGPYQVLSHWATSGPGSNGNKGVLHIPQRTYITETSPSDCLVLYPGHSLEGRGFTPLQRSSWCILLAQVTWPKFWEEWNNYQQILVSSFFSLLIMT